MELLNQDELSLDEWLNHVFNPSRDRVMVRCAFPNDRLRDEYLSTIHHRTDEDVNRLILRFLIHTGHSGLDDLRFHTLLQTKDRDPERYQFLLQRQYDRRLILYKTNRSNIPTWEGNTWVLDLLPHFPKHAIEALDAYILAHAQELSDWNIHGLFDAITLIRAKFIGLPQNLGDRVEFLLGLNPREFECIVERLYNAMGYETELTEAQKDGGKDVIARKDAIAEQVSLRIECKRYVEGVSVGIIRALLGVVADEKVNKGVLITTSYYTKPARDFASRNPRIELIDGKSLVLLLNEHLGSKWPLHIERLIQESLRGNS